MLFLTVSAGCTIWDCVGEQGSRRRSVKIDFSAVRAVIRRFFFHCLPSCFVPQRQTTESVFMNHLIITNSLERLNLYSPLLS